MTSYADKKAALLNTWSQGAGQLRLAKSTISNLFRYEARGAPARQISLGAFDQVIALDAEARTLEVEGLATFETIVAYCLPRGFLPMVAPELKHITVGGATVGIGIESTCFKHGFVHDGLIEADVLLPGGTVVTCSADNEHADLFRALPNSYGTLGYILRAKIALQPAQPYVRLQLKCYSNTREYLHALRTASEADDAEFVEGLFFEDGRFFTILGWFETNPPRVDDIVRKNIFYKLVQTNSDIYLDTFSYIFRYDPEWFWNIPETWPFRVFRRYAPKRYRNSSFYTRYAAFKKRMKERLTGSTQSDIEPLIQDWEVPWQHAEALMDFCLKNVDLGGKPWAAVPIRTPRQPTLYPIEAQTLYFNLGSYCQVQKPAGREPYHYTKIMDRLCFDLNGIKMLYSSTFLDEAEFAERFNGTAYAALKQKYDPDGNAPTLFEKVSFSARR